MIVQNFQQTWEKITSHTTELIYYLYQLILAGYITV